MGAFVDRVKGRLGIAWGALFQNGISSSGAYHHAGAPANGSNGTFANKASKGALLIDTTNAAAYQNTGSISSPTWTALGSGSGGAGGLTLISSGAVTTPVQYIDISLPSGYTYFQIALMYVSFSASDSIAYALSFDGGATFLNDTIHSDSYKDNHLFTVSSAPTTPLAQGAVDSLASIGYSQNPGVPVPATAQIVLSPGSPDWLSYSTYEGVSFGGSPDPIISYSVGAAGINPAATVVPTAARANVMRVLPFGNGDCNPPTSGETITSMSYFLYGAPTP